MRDTPYMGGGPRAAPNPCEPGRLSWPKPHSIREAPQRLSALPAFGLISCELELTTNTERLAEIAHHFEALHRYAVILSG